MSNESDHKEPEYKADSKDERADQAVSLRQLVEETLMHKGEEIKTSATQIQVVDSQLDIEETKRYVEDSHLHVEESKPSVEELQLDVGYHDNKNLEQKLTKQILDRIEEDAREERLSLDAPLEADELDMEDLIAAIEELCLSKAEEFALLGYDQVSGEEIWECVSSKYKAGYPALHVIINDILSLKADKFMNWLLIRTYRS